MRNSLGYIQRRVSSVPARDGSLGEVFEHNFYEFRFEQRRTIAKFSNARASEFSDFEVRAIYFNFVRMITYLSNGAQLSLTS